MEQSEQDLAVLAGIYKNKDEFKNEKVASLFTQFTIVTCLLYEKTDIYKNNFAELPEAQLVSELVVNNCPDCTGEGYIVIVCPDCQRRDQMSYYQGGGKKGNGVCKKCGGSGKIKRGLKAESAYGRVMQTPVNCYSCNLNSRMM